MTALTEFRTLPQPSVEIDEMAFAIALFMAAASGRVVPPGMQSCVFQVGPGPESMAELLLVGAALVLKEDEGPISDEVVLACAISVIWHHYESDPRQQVICARLVAFYVLVTRNKRALLEPWILEPDSDSETISLAPVVVEAVATAPLGDGGQFDDANFRELVQLLVERDSLPRAIMTAAGGKTTKSAKLATVALPVTKAVQQLSRHLFAFQSCVAKMPNIGGAPQFHVVEQLCGQVASISGSAALQAMLSRTLVAARADFPWLQSATVSKTGELKGLDQIEPPDLEEAMRCEVTILESLLELSRSLLGDAVTIVLLRTLWPLATLRPETSSDSL